MNGLGPRVMLVSGCKAFVPVKLSRNSRQPLSVRCAVGGELGLGTGFGWLRSEK